MRPDVDEKEVSSPSSSSSSNGGEEPSVDRGTKRLREDPAPAASARPVEAEEMLSPLEKHLDATGARISRRSWTSSGTTVEDTRGFSVIIGPVKN